MHGVCCPTVYVLGSLWFVLQVASVALLELLTTAAGTRVVAARQFFHTDGLHGLALACVAGCSLLLLHIREVATRLLILRAALGSRLIGSRRGLQLGYHGTHDDGDGAVVDGIDHVVEELDTLEFEDEERVLLLVAGVVHAVLEFVEQAQVLFPGIIYGMQNHHLVESRHDAVRLGLVSLLQVGRHVVASSSGLDGHHDVLVHLSLRALVDHFHHAVGIGCHDVCLLLEAEKYLLIGVLGQIVEFRILELLCRERHFHGQNLQEALAASFPVVVFDDVAYAIPDHVADIHAQTLTEEGMAALLVDDGTLFVHYIVVLEQTLADAEVILLDLFLRILDAAGNHRVLYHLAFLETETVHDACDTLAGKKTHQLVLERNEEHAAARVSLSARTSTQLAVHTAAFVALRANDGKSAGGFHFGREFNVSTTAGHVGGDGDRTEHTFLGLPVHHDGSLAALSGQCHDICLLLMEFGVQHLMRNLAHLQHLAQHFRDFHAGGTHQHRSAAVSHLLHLLDDGLVLLALRLIDTVVHVGAYNRAVGGHLHHVELVDIPELAGLGDCRTGHTSQLMIHAEVILQRNGGIRLRGCLHRHVLLGLDVLF